MTDDENQDIRRVISLCFRGMEQMSDLDLERILSFDMEWLSPEEAELSVSKLIDKGWLLGGRNNLSPAFTTRSITTPIGWFPRPARLINPIDYNPIISENATQKVARSISVLEATPEVQQTAPASLDPREKLSGRLAKYIARSAKISPEEIQRRVQRKQKALNYASNWLCLALIAREQNLQMEEIVAALSS
ncbi:MAG TPA: DUF2240 family protein [Candidatus Poseidoniaceae archaeon]|nr:hypothetical protein [Euryarchaeota archaeon]DAC58851.1 MAG TPA: DUF2240 family protein [Candidatus Poseidoniales archaeon]HII37455.1 DUF2240 family protein [Candidatus Poseidoniaceae archaeon]|tara:strand:- start:8923 stop:9495 length:573 start_codon:yes stop_codon:yes gene_type:complete